MEDVIFSKNSNYVVLPSSDGLPVNVAGNIYTAGTVVYLTKAQAKEALLSGKVMRDLGVRKSPVKKSDLEVSESTDVEEVSVDSDTEVGSEVAPEKRTSKLSKAIAKVAKKVKVS